MNTKPNNLIWKSIIYLMLFTLSSCIKDKPESVVQAPVTLGSSHKVYVINEGNFGLGNGSISLFDPTNNELVNDLYFSQNNTSAGDVVQSLCKFNDKFYVIVNNSKKIIQCNEQLKKTGQINDLMSPRYMLPVSNQKAYVSDLYANAISVIDLNNLSKLKEIALAGSSEKMLMIYNKVFVCNTARQYVYVINTLTDVIQDSIFVGINASSLVIDKQDNVWVLSSGDQAQNRGRLSRINSTTHEIVTYFEFETAQSPWQICINGTKDSLYFLNTHIYCMSINEGNLPVNAIVNRGNKNFYGLGYNSFDHRLYSSDALDYSQASAIYVFESTGKQVYDFKAGINANGFYFE